MQFTVSQKPLARALKALAKTLPRRPHLPVLAGIQLKVAPDQLELTTTDLTAGTKTTLPVLKAKPGQAIVSGKVFIDAINFFDGDSTEFILQEKKLQIKNHHDDVSIPILTEDYPDFTPPELKPQSLPLQFWLDIAKKVAFAASSDQSRPALTGILFRSHDHSQIVCTDGFRLVIAHPPKSQLTLAQKDIILSAKALTDATALAEVFDLEQLAIAYDDIGEQVFFQTEHFTYFAKTINSNYPPFEKIIPLEFTTEITLDREALLKNLAKASVFTKADSNTVKLEITKDKLSFTASSPTDGNFNSEQVLDSHLGAETTISFNIRYLLDFLNTRASDQIWFGCNDPTTPAMLKDPTDPTIQYVVMPFRPKN